MERTAGMSDDRASLAAFLVAPAVPAVWFALSSPGLGGGPGAGLATLAVLSLVFYLYAFVAVLLLGLPAFLLLRRYQLDGLVPTTTAAALLAVPVGLVLVSHPDYLSAAEWSWKMRWFVVMGGATGFAFWAVKWCCLGRAMR